MQYGEMEMQAYRRAFLANYQAKHRQAEFDRFEATYRIYNALDNLVYFLSVGAGERAEQMKAWAVQKMA